MFWRVRPYSIIVALNGDLFQLPADWTRGLYVMNFQILLEIKFLVTKLSQSLKIKIQSDIGH